MSFTYNENQITASGTNTISFTRFRLDDTDSTAYELSDEVIVALFAETTGSQATRNYQTAIKAAHYLWTKYSKQVTFSSAGTSMNLSDMADHWWKVIAQLQTDLAVYNGVAPVLYPIRTSSFDRW